MLWTRAIYCRNPETLYVIYYQIGSKFLLRNSFQFMISKEFWGGKFDEKF